MQTSIDAAREVRKPTESSRVAKAAALVAAATLETLAGAAIAAGPDGYMSAELSSPDRADFASDDLYRGTSEDYVAAGTS